MGDNMDVPSKADMLALCLVQLLQCEEVGPVGKWRRFKKPDKDWYYFLKGGLLRYGPTLKEAQSVRDTRVSEYYHLALGMLEREVVV